MRDKITEQEKITIFCDNNSHLTEDNLRLSEFFSLLLDNNEKYSTFANSYLQG